MPDKIFSDPELVQVYDAFDGARDDLQHYFDIVEEFGAHSILDVGCGTGCFAVMLAKAGYDVTGLDPAKASIDFAKTKEYADQVNWIYGDMSVLSSYDTKFGMAVMTGNVAQVFTDHHDWYSTLKNIRGKLEPDGHLVFEVRDPSQKAWEKWTKENTSQRIYFDGLGHVETWTQLECVDGDLVHFTHTYIYEEVNKTITSHSTLRFRTKDEIVQSLSDTGYSVLDIRDAPDRPNLEWVFICKPS